MGLVLVAGIAAAGPGGQTARPTGLDLSRQFIQNGGQWDARALFRASAPGYQYWVTRDGATYDFTGLVPKKGGERGHVVKMSFVGASASTKTTALEPLRVRNQFLNAGRPMTEAGSFGRVRVAGVYPGVDVVHYFDGKQARYDIEVSPKSDPAKVELRFAGAQGLRVDAKGDLRIKTSIGEVSQGNLFAYQVVGGARKQVSAKFVPVGKDRLKFRLGAYDKTKPVVIDPLVYGSYYGGDGQRDKVSGVVAEPDGSVYMTGWTQARAFPVTQGAYQTVYQGGRDAFITRFRGDAYAVTYNSFIGGNGADEGLFIKTDPQAQSIYVLGTTTSTNLLAPLPAGTRPPAGSDAATRRTSRDYFLFRFRKNGSGGLVPTYGRYFSPASGQFRTDPIGFDIGANGLLYITGQVDGEMPLAKDPTDEGNIFITALASGGTRVSWSRYFGRFNADVKGMTLDPSGNIFLAGTAQTGFPLLGRVFNGGRLIRQRDAYLAKFTGTGGSPIFSAVIGGSQNDFGYDVACDQDGNAFVLGYSNSFDYPRTQGGFYQLMRNQVTVTKVRGDGSEIIAGTALRTGEAGLGTGESGILFPVGLSVTGTGNVAITGRVRAVPVFTNPGPTDPPNPNVPIGQVSGSVTVSDVRQAQTNKIGIETGLKREYTWVGDSADDRLPTYDGWINVLDGNLNQFIYGSYIGGDNDEEIGRPYTDPGGDIWIFGNIDTTLGYIVFGRPPTGGGDPPDPVQVTSNSGFPSVTDEDSGQYVGFIYPAGFPFKAVGEVAVAGDYGGFIGGGDDFDIDYVFRWDGGGFPYPFNDPQRVRSGHRTDGYIFRFRFGLPVVAGVTLSDQVIPGGLNASTLLTVTLSSPAPAQGADVRVDLSSIDAAAFAGSANPSSVLLRIPAGQTTATQRIVSKPVTEPKTLSVVANYRGAVGSTTLTVIPWLQGISFTPNQLQGGFRTTGTVTLSAPAPTGGVQVPLTSSLPGVLAVPASVTVPEGQTTVSFDVVSSVVATRQTVQVRADLLGVQRASQLIVSPYTFTLQQLTITPSTIAAGGTATGTLRIDANAPDSGLTIALTSNNSAIVVPASVQIAPGDTTATFTVRGGTPVSATTGTVTARVLGQVSTANVTVGATPFTLTVDPQEVTGGGSGVRTVTGTVSLPEGLVASQNLTFTLSTNNSAIVTLGATSVTIPAGSSSATFTATVNTVANDTNVNITARLGSRTQTTTIVVKAVRLLTFTVNPTVLRPFRPALGTITLEAAAPAGGVTVTLELTEGLFETYPVTKTLVIPEGQTTATFTLVAKRFSLPITTEVKATAGGVTQSVLLQIVR